MQSEKSRAGFNQLINFNTPLNEEFWKGKCANANMQMKSKGPKRFPLFHKHAQCMMLISKIKDEKLYYGSKIAPSYNKGLSV